MNTLQRKIQSQQDLTCEEAQDMMRAMLSGDWTADEIAACLIALHQKGESVSEIIGCILEARRQMTQIKEDDIVIDTCGTGGDGSGTFNISTATALVVASAGVKVAKHGNRRASSRCGSADVLEAMGVPIAVSAPTAGDLLQRVGFVFLFAPLYHPAFAHVAPVRASLGVPTIFNLLGPFLNPAGVTRQVIGVPSQAKAELLAQVAQQLTYEHLLLVTSEDGLDEISVGAPTILYEIKGSTFRKDVFDPQAIGIPWTPKEQLQGGEASTNAAQIERILSGEKGPARDIVVVNSAAALYVAGKVPTLYDGVAVAEQALDSGAASRLVQRLREEV